MGRFKVGERIGSGGMGTVYKAFDQRLEREVAIKEIRTAGADRVLREAQAAARLNHPAIVTLYELGERDGHALLVSELVEGRTLDQVARDGMVSDRDVAHIGLDLCDALTHAHSRGVIHRDVKPQNAIVRPWDTQGRRAKLMDFGIAAVAGSPGLTATGEVVGTLAYMAPEQAEGEHAGPEADVYSLALTLYEAWAGENPVACRTPAQTARQIGRPVTPLEELRPDLPHTLTVQVDACLDPDPRNRPTLKRLHDAIERVAVQLDDEAAVPAPAGSEPVVVPRSFARIFGLVGLGMALAALAGPLGQPGLALVLTLLALPAVAVAQTPYHALLPLAGIPLGAIGGIAAAAALIGLVARRPSERLVLGCLAFLAFVVGAVGFGIGETSGIAVVAPDGWTSSPGEAISSVLRAMVLPDALIGLAVVGAGAITLGWVMRAHAAVAMVGAITWAAGLAAGLSLVGDGSQGTGAVMAVSGVGLALIARSAARGREPSDARSGFPSPRPALHGGG